MEFLKLRAKWFPLFCILHDPASVPTCRFTLSAGIAQNKLLAKHASGMHKPFQQTVVRPEVLLAEHFCKAPCKGPFYVPLAMDLWTYVAVVTLGITSDLLLVALFWY